MKKLFAKVFVFRQGVILFDFSNVEESFKKFL